MKAGDIVATTGNRFIQLTTVSRWSHVAIAIDENNVLEATPAGVIIRTLDQCVAEAKAAYVFERPKNLALGDDARGDLKKRAIELSSEGRRYSFWRAGYSGLTHIFRNIFIGFALILFSMSLFLFFYQGDIKNSYAFLLLSLVALVFGLPLSITTGMTRQFNEWLESLDAPSWLGNSLKKQYCSQLVFDIDQSMSSRFLDRESTLYELRPKDVVNACMRQKWNRVMIK